MGPDPKDKWQSNIFRIISSNIFRSWKSLNIKTTIKYNVNEWAYKIKRGNQIKIYRQLIKWLITNR
jgi:hypothetical protein